MLFAPDYYQKNIDLDDIPSGTAYAIEYRCIVVWTYPYSSKSLIGFKSCIFFETLILYPNYCELTSFTDSFL